MNEQTYYRHLSHINVGYVVKINYIYLSNWVKCMPQTAQINERWEHYAFKACASRMGGGEGYHEHRITIACTNNRTAFDRRPIEF